MLLKHFYRKRVVPVSSGQNSDRAPIYDPSVPGGGRGGRGAIPGLLTMKKRRKTERKRRRKSRRFPERMTQEGTNKINTKIILLHYYVVVLLLFLIHRNATMICLFCRSSISSSSSSSSWFSAAADYLTAFSFPGNKASHPPGDQRGREEPGRMGSLLLLLLLLYQFTISITRNSFISSSGDFSKSLLIWNFGWRGADYRTPPSQEETVESN